MAIRKCPQCLTQVSPGAAAAFSNSLVCPNCTAPLEVAGATRHLAIWAGLAAGAATYMWMEKLVALDQMSLGWALRVLAAFLSFSFTAAVVTMFADLRNRVSEPEPAAAPAAGHGHAAGHH